MALSATASSITPGRLAQAASAAYVEEDSMRNCPVIFKDGALNGTTAWADTFLKRDHHGKRDS